MEHLDTRPQDRAAQTKTRWKELHDEVQWLCADLSRMLGTPRAEGLHLRLHLAVEAREHVSSWFLRWRQAEVRR